MTQPSEVYRGPSVYEAAENRIRQIDRQIEELQLERRAAQRRLADPRWINVDEAERIATAAEPYQRTQLPEG